MMEVRLRSKIGKQELGEKVGKILTDADYNLLLTGRARVLKPDGSPLCVYLPGQLPTDLLDASYGTLHELRKIETKNRGNASGTRRVREGPGSHTNTKPISSALIGAFDPYPPYMHCRLTAWTGTETEKFRDLFPLFQAIAGAFEEYVPERYAVQMGEADKTNPAWVIEDTPSTTITCNNCVDAETECLTQRLGWTRYDQLRDDDTILAYDPETHTTRWEGLTGIFVNPAYQGEMLSLSARGFSALTTPDHRWPLRGAYPDSRAVRLSQDLPRSHYWSLSRIAPFQSEAAPVYTDAFVRLVAWYYTEGHLTPDGLKAIITQSDAVNGENVTQIRQDIADAGARRNEEWPLACAAVGCATSAFAKGLCTRHYHAMRHAERKVVNSHQQYRGGKGRRPGLWCREEPGERGMRKFHLFGDGVKELLSCAPGSEKVPTPAFLSSLTRQQADTFVEISIRADGHAKQNRFHQHNAKRMAAFLHAAVLAGLAPSLDEKGTTASLRRKTKTILTKTIQSLFVPYRGAIWCPSVPSSHWLARRRGSIYLTGNSYPTGVHTDKGDLDAGFSCLAVLRRGDYTGGRLTFPEWRVSVDMGHGDILLMNAHDWHGNTALALNSPDAERISVVCYYRTKVVACGTPEQEAAKAAMRKPALREAQVEAAKNPGI